MIYLFIYRRAVREIECRDDLNARKVAEAADNVSRVETKAGRVVWRKIPETGNAERLPKIRQS